MYLNILKRVFSRKRLKILAKRLNNYFFPSEKVPNYYIKKTHFNYFKKSIFNNI